MIKLSIKNRFHILTAILLIIGQASYSADSAQTKDSKTKYLKQEELPTTIISNSENPLDMESTVKNLTDISFMEKIKRTSKDIRQWTKNSDKIKSIRNQAKERVKKFKSKCLEPNNLKNGIDNTSTVLSVIDSANNSYYVGKDDKIHFSATKYLSNVAKNFSGLSTVTGTVDAMVDANKKEYNRIINEYKNKHKGEAIPKEIIAKAQHDAFQKGMLVGAYNGAKCIPYLGQAILIVELTESTVGLVNDTSQSSAIQKENKLSQAEQAKRALNKINKYYAKYKTCKTEVERLQRISTETIKKFNSFKKQTNQAFIKSIEFEKAFAKSDKLKSAIENSGDILSIKHYTELNSEVKKMSNAIASTIKVIHASSGKNQSQSIATLKQMRDTLSKYNKKCLSANKTLLPIIEKRKTTNDTNNLVIDASKNQLLAIESYSSAKDSLSIHNKIIEKCRKLKQLQEKLLSETTRLRRYFYKAGDEKIKADLEIGYRTALQFKIDDFTISQLSKKQQTMTFDFGRLRKPSAISNNNSDQLSSKIALAMLLSPRYLSLSKSIENILNDSTNIIKLSEITSSIIDNKINFKDKTNQSDFINMSRDDIEKASSLPTRNDIKKGDIRYGFTYHKRSKSINWKDKEGAKPQYNNSYKKLLEKGKMKIWDDQNRNNIKDDGEEKILPFWIWYEARVYVDSVALWLEKKDTESRCTGIEKFISNPKTFTDSNVEFGIIGAPLRLKTPAKSAIKGKASYFPFFSSVEVKVVSQIGTDVFDGDGARNCKAGIIYKNKDRILEKIKFWEAGLPKVTKSLLNASLSLPKAYSKYLHKVLFRNTHIAKKVIPTDFKIKRYIKKSGKSWDSLFNTEFSKQQKQTISGKQIKSSENYSICIKIYDPRIKESIKSFFKRIQEKEFKYFTRLNKKRKIINLSFGSGKALMVSECKQHNITNYNKTILIATQLKGYEKIILVKNNMVAEIVGRGTITGKNAKFRTLDFAKEISSIFNR